MRNDRELMSIRWNFNSAMKMYTYKTAQLCSRCTRTCWSHNSCLTIQEIKKPATLIEWQVIQKSASSRARQGLCPLIFFRSLTVKPSQLLPVVFRHSASKSRSWKNQPERPDSVPPREYRSSGCQKPTAQHKNARHVGSMPAMGVWSGLPLIRR